MIIENIFDGSLYGLTPKQSVEGDNILIQGEGTIKLVMIFEASSINTGFTHINVSKIEYSENGVDWTAGEGTYVDGLTFTLYKSVRNVVYGDPDDLIAITIDAVDYLYGSSTKEFRKLTFNLEIVTEDGSDSIHVYPTLIQKGCAGAVIITWENYNGDILDETEVAVGSMPVYLGPTPIKESDCSYNYEFNGWTPEIEIATEEATYTATYSSEYRLYTVKWVNYNGEILKEVNAAHCTDNPLYDGQTPTRPTEGGISYTFDGWSPQEGPITGDTIYTAQYSESVVQYIIRFVNYDNSVLYTTTVPNGTVPTYVGAEPTREQTQQYTFTFNGWDHTVTSATRDDTYKATFTSQLRRYQVSWNMQNGEPIDTSYVEYGTIPYHYEPEKGSTSTREIYTFSHWSPTQYPVTSDQSYTANYSISEGCHIKYMTIGTTSLGNISDFNDNVDYGYGNTAVELIYGVNTKTGKIYFSTNNGCPKLIGPQDTSSDNYGNVYNINTELKVIELPDTVEETKDHAFSHAYNLNRANLTSLYTIAAYSFEGCAFEAILITEDYSSTDQTKKAAYVDDGKLSVIGDKAFFECRSLSSVTIPSSVSVIGKRAFENCRNLENVYFWANTVLDRIEDYTFEYCRKLKLVQLRNIENLQYIGGYAFSHCTSLESISIPGSIKEISICAFLGCENLSSIRIGSRDGLTNSLVVHGSAFDYCSSLTSITIYSEDVVALAGSVQSCTGSSCFKPNQCELHVMINKGYEYEHSGWGYSGFLIRADLTY